MVKGTVHIDVNDLISYCRKYHFDPKEIRDWMKCLRSKRPILHKKGRTYCFFFRDSSHKGVEIKICPKNHNIIWIGVEGRNGLHHKEIHNCVESIPA